MNMKINVQFSRAFALTALTILLVVPVFVFTTPHSHAAQNIVDGDLVTVSPNPDIYIVKIIGVKKFKRLILNPDIFNSYGNLKWSNVKTIDQATLDSYKLSDLVIEVNPDGSVADPKVYRVVSSENSDVGERSWLNLTASEFEAAGYDWDSLYHVNHKEALPSFYPTKAPLIYQDILTGRQNTQTVPLVPATTTPSTTSTQPRYITTEGGAIYDTVLKQFISSTPTATQSSAVVVGSITLSANPSMIPADGKSTSIITATAKDVNGNMAANQVVYFSYGNVTVAATTNTSGAANITYIADTNAGTITFTANVGNVKSVTQISKTSTVVGTLVVTKDPTSPGGNIAKDYTDQEFARFSFTASGEAMKISSLNVSAATTGSVGINNAKLYVNGIQIGATTDLPTNGITTFTLSNSFVIPAGTIQVLIVKGEVKHADGTPFFTGNTIQISLAAGSNNAQGQTLLTSINTSAANGNTLTVQSALEVTLNPGLANATSSSPTGMVGAKIVKISSFVITIGSESDLTLSSYVLKNSAVASLALGNDFENLRLMHSTTQIALTLPSLSKNPNETYTFGPFATTNIQPGQQYMVDVYADILPNALNTATPPYTAVLFDSVTGYMPASGASAGWGGGEADIAGQLVYISTSN